MTLLLQRLEHIQLLQRLRGRDVELVAVRAHLIAQQVVVQQAELRHLGGKGGGGSDTRGDMR